MLVQVSGKGFELCPELRDDIEEKMTTILDRFRSRIGMVNVFLADVNGRASCIAWLNDSLWANDIH